MNFTIPLLALKKIQNTATDQEIIDLLKARDQRGIELLYEQHGALIYGLICKVVKMEDFAENVLQDTFVKIWQKIDSFDFSKGHLLGWIISIARNTAIDAIRSKAFQQHRQTVPHQQDTTQQADFSTDVKTDYIGLKDVVRRLEPKYAVVLDLVYFSGYTHAEVAEQLDLPLGTVKSRIRKAIRELRTYFAHEEY